MPKPKKERAEQRAAIPAFQNDDQVYSFSQWCALNGFSEPTGKRVIARGECEYVQLSL
jgi:hypothetical protein